ncbi:hypothetical protein CORT_0B03660 [Candida orthopsilosis Co 90-125]|uniref:Uncharacterized protein n=1 Tax=Candida orthopsilosis (strain 90-125) TaxID=1136231 RepID=H8X134_CANO9|nr:hypothetical protein CORT_0B03660 [Candida orthopsilosis Co 90-125]CCG22074.1 hypothetical protein CORT_0B03660 [Candida orthopsilosis Co 90-125]
MVSWLQLLPIIFKNIKDDFIANFVTRLPLLLVVDPDSFEPPFTNGLNDFLEMVNLTTVADLQQLNIPVSSRDLIYYTMIEYGILLLSVVFAGFDILYSMLRLCMSAVVIGGLVSVLAFCTIWLIVTLTRRWKLISMIIRNNEFEGVW